MTRSMEWSTRRMTRIVGAGGNDEEDGWVEEADDEDGQGGR